MIIGLSVVLGVGYSVVVTFGPISIHSFVINHAGAIVSGSSGTAQAEKEALEAAGVKVGKTPSEAANLMREIFAAK